MKSFFGKHIFKVDHLKKAYLTKLTDDARKKKKKKKKNICHPRSKQKYQTTPRPGEIDLKTHPLIFHSHIHSSGVDIKTIGNHIARFKDIYLRKLTKSKIHAVFTCLLTVCKSVSHGRLLLIAPYDITRRALR